MILQTSNLTTSHYNESNQEANIQDTFLKRIDRKPRYKHYHADGTITVDAPVEVAKNLGKTTNQIANQLPAFQLTNQPQIDTWDQAKSIKEHNIVSLISNEVKQPITSVSNVSVPLVGQASLPKDKLGEDPNIRKEEVAMDSAFLKVKYETHGSSSIQKKPMENIPLKYHYEQHAGTAVLSKTVKTRKTKTKK